MQYSATTPIGYINQLEEGWRKEKLLQLKTILQKKASELQVGMEYKMLSFSDSQGSVFHLNAQKHHVGLYVGNASKIDIDGDLLNGLDVGKGCIRFKKTTSIDEDKIGEFIEKTLQLRAQGADISC